MPKVKFNQKRYTLRENETVLDCLLRHGVDYPCSCRSGVCQSCLAELTDGKLEPAWQKGLKDTLVAKSCFLPCLAKPRTDVALALPDLNEMTSSAVIKQITYFVENVICLRLLVDNLTQWTPGQYVNLINTQGCRRSYSIANVPEEDGYLDLHIKLTPGGIMSDWLKNIACTGLKVYLQGPMGECFYVNPQQESFPMILAGTGTGLAPLLAITREALRQQHQGNIVLIHGGVSKKDLYLDVVLKQLAKKNAQLVYRCCVLQDENACQNEDINQALSQTVKSYPQARVYVCGPEATVKKLKTTAFLAGAPSKFIYSDAFLNSAYGR